MLPEQDRLLLAAYIDGELGARQQRQLYKLLRRSVEARELLRQLQGQARALRQLPRVQSHPALSDSVLQAIHARQLKPRPRRVVPVRAFLPVWAGYAAAAAVLFVVCTASYVYFAQTLDQPSVVNVANHGGPNNSATPNATVPNSAVVNAVGSAQAPEQLPIMPVRELPLETTPVVQVPVPDDLKPLDGDPSNPEKSKDPFVVTAPFEMVELKMVDIAAPVIVKLQDADQPNGKLFREELAKANAFRIELPCRNGSHAFERFQAACKAQDLTLHIDQIAGERLKHPQLRSSYAVYVEDLTPDELTRLLQQVAGEDKKPDGKKAVEAQFDRLVLVRLNKRDRKELTDLLGSDPLTNAAAVGPLGTDLHKPVSDQTGSQIAAALAGQGSGKPAKGQDHLALVVPYAPQRPATNSVEIKRYFDSRKPARAGTLQLFVVLREIGA